ncbi:MAG: alpha/beta hydrolase [Thermoguttaceae bacterium]|jgi:pimeloyl-ACP methyl ester carboxylesterase
MDSQDGFIVQHTPMRSLVNLVIDGLPVIGTEHHPRSAPMASTSVMHAHDTGILLIGSGEYRRCGYAGYAALAGDVLAAAGFRTFRFDLPGIGESLGPLPGDYVTFSRFVQDGGYAPFVLSVAAQVRSQWGLRDVVIGGLCSGAITSIYAADRNLDGIAGLIAIDPELSLEHPKALAIDEKCSRFALPSRRHPRLLAVRQCVDWMSARSTVAHHALWLWRRAVRSVFPFGLHEQDFNVQLALAFRRLIKRGLPILLIMIEQRNRRELKRYIPRIYCTKSVRNVFLSGTNHSLTYEYGKYDVAREIQRWSLDLFAPNCASDVLCAGAVSTVCVCPRPQQLGTQAGEASASGVDACHDRRARPET